MPEIGSYVIYGANGICIVKDKRKEKLCGTKKEYFVLAPIENSHAQIFVPTDNSELLKKMKAILSRDEIIDLIKNIDESETVWIDDNKKRAEKFSSIISQGDRRELLKLIKCIYLKKKEMTASGKKLWAADENMLKNAEKTINAEFSLVLGILPEEVPHFIEVNI